MQLALSLLILTGFEIGEEFAVLPHALIIMVLEEDDHLHLTLVTNLADHAVIEQLNGLPLFLQRDIGRDTDKKRNLIHRAAADILLGDFTEIEAQSVGVHRAQVPGQSLAQSFFLLIGKLQRGDSKNSCHAYNILSFLVKKQV